METLPTLRVATAVPRAGHFYPSEASTLALGGGTAVPLQLDVQPTNGVVYAAARFDLSALPARLVPYLPFFESYLESLGTKSYDYKALAHFEKAKTAGVGSDFSVRTGLGANLPLEAPSLTLSGGALERNAGALCDLFGELSAAGSVRWRGAEDRLAELLQRRAAALGSGIASAGGSYAARRARAPLTAEGAFTDALGGLPHVILARRLGSAVGAGGGARDDALEEVAAACEAIHAHAFRRATLLRARAVAQRSALDGALLPPLEQWAATLPDAPTPAAEPTLLDAWGGESSGGGGGVARREFISIPTQTNSVVRTVKTVPYDHADAAPLVLLSQVLSLGFLHREIREKGGAYGGGAAANVGGGTFTFSSYRDPNQAETLRAFDNAVAWAASAGAIGPREVEEAQLQCFKAIDSPVAPRARGARRFAHPELGDDERQAFRERLLDASAADLRRVAAERLAGGGDGARAAECIVGNVGGLEVKGWSVMTAELKPLRD